MLAAPSARAQGAGEPTGVWLTQAGDARVKVSKCGGGICGVIVGLKDPIDPATGKPQVDDKNPNPALKKRPMIGLPLFSGMQPVAPNKWSGQIYNADDGGTYASSVSVAGPDTLGSKAASARSAAARPGRGWDGSSELSSGLGKAKRAHHLIADASAERWWARCALPTLRMTTLTPPSPSARSPPTHSRRGRRR